MGASFWFSLVSLMRPTDDNWEMGENESFKLSLITNFEELRVSVLPTSKQKDPYENMMT